MGQLFKVSLIYLLMLRVARTSTATTMFYLRRDAPLLTKVPDASLNLMRGAWADREANFVVLTPKPKATLTCGIIGATDGSRRQRL